MAVGTSLRRGRPRIAARLDQSSGFAGTQKERIARNPVRRQVTHRCGRTSPLAFPEADAAGCKPRPRLSGSFPRDGVLGARHGQDTRAVPAQRIRQGGVRRRRREPAQCAAPRRRRHVGQVRLRPGHLRRVHRADRRRAAARLPHAGRDLRRARHRNGARASPTGPTCIRCRRPSWSISRPSAASAPPAC